MHDNALLIKPHDPAVFLRVRHAYEPSASHTFPIAYAHPLNPTSFANSIHRLHLNRRPSLVSTASDIHKLELQRRRKRIIRSSQSDLPPLVFAVVSSLGPAMQLRRCDTE